MREVTDADAERGRRRKRHDHQSPIRHRHQNHALHDPVRTFGEAMQDSKDAVKSEFAGRMDPDIDADKHRVRLTAV